MLMEDLLCRYDSNQDRHCPPAFMTMTFSLEMDKEKCQQTKSLQILVSTTKEIAEQERSAPDLAVKNGLSKERLFLAEI